MKTENRKSARITTAPSGLVVSLERFKQFARIDADTEDDLITMYIKAATDAAQRYCQRYFINTTISFTMDSFSNCQLYEYGMMEGPTPSPYRTDSIELPYPPIQSITSITTYDVANTSTVLSSSAYTLDIEGGRVFLNEGYSWPTNLRDKNAVVIVFVAGYGTAGSDAPAAIQMAVLQHAGQMYDCRGSCDMSDSCKGLLMPYRIYDLLAWS